MGGTPFIRLGLLATAVAATTVACGSSGTSASLQVDPPVALFDKPVRIVLSGVKPNAQVVLRASTTDRTGALFVSTTKLRANARGYVALQGDQAMRVLWSMRPGDALQWGLDPSGSSVKIALEATVRGRRIAKTTIERDLVAAGVRDTPLRVAQQGIYGELYAPKPPAGRGPGILLFGGSEGGLSVGGEAALLASHGYPTLALAYFHEPGLPKNLLRVPLEYFARALQYLARQPGVDPSRLVVYGISRGSEAAQLVGVHYPQLVHAVVALVPSNSAICGIPRFTGQNKLPCIGPAWTFRGKPVPYSRFPTVSTKTPIPVERIDGPIFMDCGQLDQLWASCPMAHAIYDRLQAKGFKHRVFLMDFANGGHGVGGLIPYWPAKSLLTSGLTDDSNQIARSAAWPQLLRFLSALRRNATA